MRENRVSGLMRGGCGLLRWLAAFYSNITLFCILVTQANAKTSTNPIRVCVISCDESRKGTSKVISRTSLLLCVSSDA